MTDPLFLRWRNNFLTVLLLSAAFVILGLHLAQPINLAATDIGRHIKNGELILEGQRDVLFKNTYSFTHPEHPFINHHWFFGVLSYVVWQCAGFSGLTIAYMAIVLLALFFFVRAGALRGHTALVVLFTMLSLPLLWDRREIRPEGLSILFMGLYFYLLTKLSLGRIKQVIVFAVIVTAQIIWVNTHIFFFMGPVLIALFMWEGASRGCRVCVRNLQPMLTISILVNLINPAGINGALTPFNIFKEFGYRLAENQNVFFMMGFFPDQKIYIYYLFLVAVAVLGIGLASMVRGWKTNAAFIVLTVFTILAGIKAVRLMPVFGFFLVVLGPFFYKQFEGHFSKKVQDQARSVVLLLSLLLGIWHVIGLKGQSAGLGLQPGVNASAEFFKSAGLKGPIFSNYDIGGYLIYHLEDQEKVFVDNRQEAFPVGFFKNVYIPMQEDNARWQAVDGQYGFNAIYFYRHDLTTWGQHFLIERMDDPQWAPVFVDGYTIIYLKRNDQNALAIQKYELPRSMFGVKHK